MLSLTNKMLIYIVSGYAQKKAVIQSEISEAFINFEFMNGSRADRLNYSPIILWVHILLLKNISFLISYTGIHKV